MHSEYRPGGLFPDFVLPDQTKTPRRLSALQGEGPMLLALIRGLCCPKDREQLQALTRWHARPAARCCALAVITPDDWLTALTQRHQLGATYPILCDPLGQVRATLGLATPDTGPLHSMTFLLAPDRRVRRVWSGPYYWDRPSPCELHDALRDAARAG